MYKKLFIIITTALIVSTVWAQTSSIRASVFDAETKEFDEIFDYEDKYDPTCISFVEYNVEIISNPAKSEITLNTNSSIIYVDRIEIFNQLGIMVLQKTVGKSIGKISLESLSKGNYVIKIHLSNGKTETQKIIKER